MSTPRDDGKGSSSNGTSKSKQAKSRTATPGSSTKKNTSAATSESGQTQMADSSNGVGLVHTQTNNGGPNGSGAFGHSKKSAQKNRHGGNGGSNGANNNPGPVNDSTSRLPVYQGSVPHHKTQDHRRHDNDCAIHGIGTSPRSHLVPYDIQLSQPVNSYSHQFTPNIFPAKPNHSAPNSKRVTPHPSGPNTPTGSRRPSATSNYGKPNSTQSSPRNATSNNMKSRQAKYEEYMPLCEIQSALKKGEIIEVRLLNVLLSCVS